MMAFRVLGGRLLVRPSQASQLPTLSNAWGAANEVNVDTSLVPVAIVALGRGDFATAGMDVGDFVYVEAHRLDTAPSIELQGERLLVIDTHAVVAIDEEDAP